MNTVLQEHISRARVLAMAGDVIEAERLLREALAERGPDGELHALLGYALQQQGKYEEALEASASALAHENSWLAQFVSGLSLEALGRLPEARTAYDRASEVAPEDLQTFERRLDLSQKVSGWSEARRVFCGASEALREKLPKVRQAEFLAEEPPPAPRRGGPAPAAEWPGYQPHVPGQKIRIAFVVQFAPLWSTLASVWEACRSHADIDCHVVLAPFRNSAEPARFYDGCVDLLLERDIPFYTYDAYGLESFRPHAVFVQNPYDETRPASLALDAFRRHGVRVCYVPYGLEIGGGGANLSYQYDLSVQRRAWRIFARSQRQLKMFGRYCRTGNGHVVVTGHPKLDALAEMPAEVPLASHIRGRRAVLWTPHFSVAREALWSTFPAFSEHIVSLFEKRDDLFLVVRPHPLLFGNLRSSGYWTSSDEEEFRARIGRAENMHLDDASEYRPVFAVADALMADAGSFLLEFLPLGKPILYLRPPVGPGLSQEGEIVGSYYQAEDTGGIDRFVDMVVAGEDPLRQQRMAALDEYLMRPDGKAGTRICDHVVEAIMRGNDGSASQVATGETDAAARYWCSAETTYLAPPDYYERQEQTLGGMLQDLGHAQEALDLGCGDGRFTLLIAEWADRVTGVDLSERLIAQARAAAEQRGVANIVWQAADLRNGIPGGTFDLVCCLGVTSSLVEEVDFTQFVGRLVAVMRDGGRLIVKDTLTLGRDQLLQDSSGYTARYREVNDYLGAFTRRGLKVQAEVELARIEDRNLVNRMYVFRRTGARR